MAFTAAINNKKTFLLKPFSASGMQCMSSLGKPPQRQGKNTDKEVAEGQPEAAEGWWMPHPRTGIYFPKGQERVMDDIPNGAASFECSFWLRGIDGVDHRHNYHNKQDN